MIKKLLLYRGRSGQPFYILHRLTGLGLLIYLIQHILSMALVYFSPALFEKINAIYQSFPFVFVDVVLLFCVFFHSVNGLRRVYFDLIARHWQVKIQLTWNRIVWIATLILWLPSMAWVIRTQLIYHFGLFK